MLLKKTLNRFVLKKNPKKNDKPANALPLGRKGRLGFSVYAAAVLCFCCFSIPAFAASDPLGVVNNLSDFIFSLIRAIGLILLGWGVVQVGLSLLHPAFGVRYGAHFVRATHAVKLTNKCACPYSVRKLWKYRFFLLPMYKGGAKIE